MAGKTAILSVRILGDAKGAVEAMGKAEGRAGKLGSALKGIGGIALGAATVAGGALIGLGVAGVKAAGDLEQSVGAVDSVFKGSADQVHAFADSAATNLGLTGNEYRELATLMGTQLKNGGTSMDELAGKTDSLMTAGADMASMFGGTTSDAVSAISSALKGERDPIEKYGVSLKQAGIDARAAELGFTKVGGALTDEAQQAATLSLIMEQTADAHGNFGKETGTFAGQVSILTAQWGNFVAQVGTMLLPLLTTLLTFITGSIMPGLQSFADVIGPVISGAFSQVVPYITGFISSLGGVAGAGAPLQALFAALLPSIMSFGSTLSGLLPMITGMVTAMLPSIMSIGQAVLGLVPTLMSFASTILPLIIGAVTTIMPLIAQAAGTILPAVIGVVQRLLPIVAQIASTVIPMVVGAVQKLIPIILGLVPPIMSIVNTIIDILGPAISFLLPIVELVFNNLVIVIGGAIGVITGVLTAVAALLRGDFAGAWEAIKGIVGTVIETVKEQVNNGMNFVKEHMSGAIETVKTTFRDGWATIVSTVQEKIGELTGKVQEIPGKIKDALGNMGELLKQAGKDLIQGLINGIGSMGSALKDKASNLAGGAIDSIKGTLGIASPSRVMMQVGKWTGEGFINGIDRMRRNAAGAMGDLVTVPDVPRIPLNAQASAARAGSSGPAQVHLHIDGAFVGDELSLARELERLLASRRELLGGAA